MSDQENDVREERQSRDDYSDGGDVDRKPDVDEDRRDGERSMSDKQCYNCQGYGHLSRNCPEERKNDGGRGGGRRGGGDQQCYNCQGFGHISRNCPEPRNDDRRGGGDRFGGDRDRDRDNKRDGFSILVRKLAPNTTVDAIRDAFSKFGEIKDVYVPTDYRSRQPKDFGFVEFAESDCAETAVKEMDGSDFGGSTIEVVEARQRRKTREEMSGGRGGRRRGGGDRFGGRDRRDDRRYDSRDDDRRYDDRRRDFRGRDDRYDDRRYDRRDDDRRYDRRDDDRSRSPPRDRRSPSR